MPWGNSRKVANHACLARPNSSTALHPSAPPITAQTAIVSMSDST